MMQWRSTISSSRLMGRLRAPSIVSWTDLTLVRLRSHRAGMQPDAGSELRIASHFSRWLIRIQSRGNEAYTLSETSSNAGSIREATTRFSVMTQQSAASRLGPRGQGWITFLSHDISGTGTQKHTEPHGFERKEQPRQLTTSVFRPESKLNDGPT